MYTLDMTGIVVTRFVYFEKNLQAKQDKNHLVNPENPVNPV
jgi:hypothetical protein